MKRRIHTAVLVVLAFCAFWLAGGIGFALRDLRARADDGHEMIADAPPAVAVTSIVLGGFRGILADILWLRASHLQDQGRYFELVQLASWVTRLEPRVSEVWSYHAWNMAYNVSVMMPSAEDRWRWINNAISLLRDQGLRYNSSDPDIYWEIGWLYQHKIGAPTDRMHRYYKTRLAMLVEDAMQGTRSDDEIARALREKLGLKLETMQEVEAAYGPLDWRIPETHAVYWAHCGLKVAGDDGHERCERMLFQCLAILFERGVLTTKPDNPKFGRKPNLAILPQVIRVFEHATAKYHEKGIETAYRNFLVKAVWVLRRENREETAREVFDRLCRRFPREFATTYEMFDAEAELNRTPEVEMNK